MRRSLYAINAVILSLIFLGGTALSQSDPFYKGKTRQIIVASATGAGNDLRTRLFARHAPKHIPGKPDIVVQNMPGAGGLRARNHVYNIAKPDGLNGVSRSHRRPGGTIQIRSVPLARQFNDRSSRMYRSNGPRRQQSQGSHQALRQ